MTFAELLTQVRELLQSKGRVSYRALKLQFHIDDEYLAGIKDELIEAEQVARDEEGKVLVWTGASPVSSSRLQDPSSEGSDQQSATSNSFPLPQDSALRTQHSDAERRQLTVMFCDLVGSTALSARLDPEELRDIIRTYQQNAEGSNPRLPSNQYDVLESAAERRMKVGRSFKAGLQVRIGIHTGPTVIGDIGALGRTEQLALGETPNLAARIQGLAEPNTVIVSAATQRLIDSEFECQPFGSHLVKGLNTPIAVYHVQSERQSVSPFAGRTSLTPLVGREQEVGLLLDRWEQVKEGQGQVVLLSGEPGIGKSRLAYTLKEHVTNEGSLFFEARCSPYYQHSALYPLIDVLQRTLLLTRQDTDEEKTAKLERTLALYDIQESLPLFTALLSLPTPPHYPSLNLTPQKQKERTLQALLQLLVAQAERQATVSVWEDLH